ncbi:unnamed protein product [Soboliphyme baturini]|uniref:Tr-type G domain-containing protein n=1 Tax=Soboliphyme baturini TaxID=241478 RepID=A0A183IX62_9BILA|nr:unnamed protein product [Soboliphyme baturini]
MPRVFNFNVGLLGHVDSGKTSLAKALSTKKSTAAFDKNPQSQERGITLDLGFSTFSIECNPELKAKDSRFSNYDLIQFTLVDCPGHASLIRTVIGGAQIIDLILLVIDVMKGIQTQTAECIVLGEICCPGRMVIALNKADLLPEDSFDEAVEKQQKKFNRVLSETSFRNCEIVPSSAVALHDSPLIIKLLDVLKNSLYFPDRSCGGDFLFAVDHCFSLRGQGTVMTGTVLNGDAKLGDLIEIPQLKESRKLKSIQVYGNPVNSISQGDRAGICVPQLDAKAFERGLICKNGAVTLIYACIVSVQRIRYFKQPILSKSKFHTSIGYETVMAKCSFFQCVYDDCHCGGSAKRHVYAVLEFEHAIFSTLDAIYITSRLDNDINLKQCRLGFHGRILLAFKNQTYDQQDLRSLKVFKLKHKQGTVDRMIDDRTVIVKGLFKKETNLDCFLRCNVTLSTGEVGEITGSFGQSGKVKVFVPSGLLHSTVEILRGHSESKMIPRAAKAVTIDSSSKTTAVVTVALTFKRYLHDSSKKGEDEDMGDDDEELEDEDDISESTGEEDAEFEGARKINILVSSPRLDSIVKSAFKLHRR